MLQTASKLLFVATLMIVGRSSASAETPAGKFKDCDSCSEMIVLPSGQFLMGSTPSFAGKPTPKSEQPQHLVSIVSFAIGKNEVTQEQWFAVMGDHPSKYDGPNLPVERVSLEDVQAFIEKLNAKTGKHYRLPTESEWEYAARAGTLTRYSFGDDESKLGDYAWFGGMTGNADGKTHPVGEKLPNQFGLFDMYGNVSEWIEDCYTENYDRAPSDGSAVGGDACDADQYHVIRGGAFNSVPSALLSANRRKDRPKSLIPDRGFRLAITLPRE